MVSRGVKESSRNGNALYPPLNSISITTSTHLPCSLRRNYADNTGAALPTCTRLKCTPVLLPTSLRHHAVHSRMMQAILVYSELGMLAID